MKNFSTLATRILSTFCVGIMLVSVCIAQEFGMTDISSYEKTKFPEDITKLWLSDGNSKSDTVIIFCQGGPDKFLTFEKLGKSRLRYLPNYKNYNIAYLHQAHTFNQEIYNYAGSFTTEMAEMAASETTEMLDRAIKHFKNQNKKVIVIAESYGAFVVNDYLATKKSLADKYVIISSRININQDVVKRNRKGLGGRFDEAGKTFIPSKTDPTKFEENRRREYIVTQMLKWAYGQPRYSEYLAEKDLSNIIFFYATNDRNVGRLTEEEIKFLKDRNAQVYATNAGHSDTFYKFIDAVTEGKIKL